MRNAQELIPDKYAHDRGVVCETVEITIGTTVKVQAETIAVRILLLLKWSRDQNMSEVISDWNKRIIRVLAVTLLDTKTLMIV
jgi:hypothetical protein